MSSFMVSWDSWIYFIEKRQYFLKTFPIILQSDHCIYLFFIDILENMFGIFSSPEIGVNSYNSWILTAKRHSIPFELEACDTSYLAVSSQPVSLKVICLKHGTSKLNGLQSYFFRIVEGFSKPGLCPCHYSLCLFCLFCLETVNKTVSWGEF